MKRMRFFAVIFTILIGIVASNFVTSEKVSALTPMEECMVAAGTSQAKMDACITAQNPTLKKITEQEYKALQEYADEIDTIWVEELNRGALVPAIPALLRLQSPSKKYLEFLEQAYTTHKNDPTATRDSVDQEALNSFITYLNSEIPKTAEPNTRVLGLILADATESFQHSVSAVQLENGAISTEQDDANLENATAAANEQKKQLNEVTGSKCWSIVTSPISDCIDVAFTWVITHTLLALAGWLLWITATVMNYSINVGILQFASWAPEALYPVWLIVRQITSLFVVFAGLWLGFMYIIDKGDQFKKYIPTVLIFALFVNFSYPLTRTVIDISNIISLNVYASTVGGSTLDSSSDKTAGTLIMNKLGLKGVVDYATGDTKDGEASLNKINSVGPALLAVAFILYAAWIFFIISALIITRTAVLVFLIIASPLLFVDKVIPKLGEHATKLRGIFVEMLFVGPVFTIMLALTLKFLEVFQSGELRKGGSISSIANGGDGAITMFFNMLMMLIMLHIMFKVTKATSGKIGEAVAGVASTVGGAAFGGVALGGAGMLGRATLGRAAAAARDSGWMQKAQGGALGRHAYNLSDTFAKGAYDGRNSAAVKFGASKLGTNFGMGGTKGREELANEHRTKLEAHLGRVGVHQKNVYDADGKLIAEKGTIDTSPQALAARQRIIDGSGSVFGSKQDNFDARYQLNEANKKFALAEMSKLGTNDEDQKKAESLLARYDGDEKMKKKLNDAFTKKIAEEFALLDDAGEKLAFISRLHSADSGTKSGKTMNETASRIENSDAQKAINEYNSQATQKAKDDYAAKQTAQTQQAIIEHDLKKEKAENKKDAANAASVAATNAVAAEQARTTQAMVDLLAHFTTPSSTPHP